MKKSIMVGIVLAMVAVFGVAGAVSAQGPNPPEETPENGYVHDYLIGYASEVLGIDAEIIQVRIDAGETLAQIVFAAGIEDFTTFMQDARSYVTEQLAADGILIPGWANSQNGKGNASQEFMRNGENAQNQAFVQTGDCLLTDAEGNQTQQMGRGYRGGRK